MFSRAFLKKLARKENVPFSYLEKKLKEGRVIIPLNSKKEIKGIVAIGEGLKVKINTNIGTSTDIADLKEEVDKLKTAINTGTDTVMDLSIGENIDKIRKTIVKNSSVPVGTVPIYEAAQTAEKRRGSIDKIKLDDILDTIKEQAIDGVDFFTIHAGILKNTIDILNENKRVGGIVSRGGAIIARWMYVNRKENPLYEHFDDILDIAKKYRITISLGDALRPGAIADSTDRLQLSELFVLSTLIKKCQARGVQVMVEGPGHIRLDEIAMNVILQKKICSKTPFYILGPLPTDIASGYDHITSAIGGAIAAMQGADFLCVVTPAEHLRHPSAEDIKEGIIASRIAAHSVDLLRFKDEREKDNTLSYYRAHREWENIFKLTIDKEKAKRYRKSAKVTSEDVCTMCGQFCSLKIIDKCHLLK